MSVPVLTVTAIVMCAHGGKVVLMPNNKVLMSGAPAAMWQPVLPVVGCPILSPDVSVSPLPNSFSTRITSNGQPMLLQTITGPGTSGSPIAPAISAGQTKVTAS